MTTSPNERFDVYTAITNQIISAIAEVNRVPRFACLDGGVEDVDVVGGHCPSFGVIGGRRNDPPAPLVGVRRSAARLRAERRRSGRGRRA